MPPRIGKVTKVYPDIQAVDLVLVNTQQPIARARVAASAAGGTWNVPNVDPPPQGTAPAAFLPGKRNLYAVVSTIEGRVMVTSWATPHGSMLSFKEQDREVHLHPASGAYWTFAPDGSFEVFHPSGALFRIGTGGHQDLGTVSDTWKEASGGAPATLTLALKSGFTLQVDPSGNVSLQAQGKLTAQVTGDVSLSSGGALKLAGASIELAGPVTADNDVTVKGNETVQGNLRYGGTLAHT